MILLCLFSTLPASAMTAKDLANFGDTPVAIAWRESGTIYVAIANEAYARQQFTIEIYERYGRTPLERKSVVIPSNTVVIDAFNLRWSSQEIEEVVIYSASRTKRIIVQENDLFEVKDYVIPANSNLKVGVDFYTIKGNSGQGRLVIDQNFRLSGTSRSGQISVSNFHSGYDYSWGNVINYQAPSLELSMWVPWMQGVSILSFGVTHFADWGGSRNFYYAPALLVYGEDYRLIDTTARPTTPEPGYSDRVPK